MKKFSTQSIGETGEMYAAEFLKKKKYKIIEKIIVKGMAKLI